MGLVEVKAEIPPAWVETVNQALLESGREKWSVVEDVILQRAGVLGILPGDFVLSRPA